MRQLLEPNLIKALEHDRDRLENTEVPMVTLSATFREDLKEYYGFTFDDKAEDVVLSRAHFSMTLGVAMEAWGAEKITQLDPKKAWFVDPTNYLPPDKLKKIVFTQHVGRILARRPLLKYLKDFIDRFGRTKLPILGSITPTILYLTEEVKRPILSFHVAVGNLLAAQGKNVIQVITDPHVRPEYVMHADLPNVRFCVFDDRTKLEFLEVAATHHVKASPRRVIVTGPPIDPRIVEVRQKKVAWRKGPLKLCITTGGLGTNKYEIYQVLLQLLPELRKKPLAYQIVIYAGTQGDIGDMVRRLAKQARVAIGKDNDTSAPLRLLYHPQIVDANELLIKYAFPWAHGFITKPSGDMAYDAVAAGCFLLTLQEWGVWEKNIREIFEQKEISRRAQVERIIEQLQLLQSTQTGTSWVERAMNRALSIEKLFLVGSKKILEVVKEKLK